jgi:tRNA A-37 threonylcarbamoyl transferase component Bud32
MIKAGTGPCHLNGNRLYFEDGWEDRLKEIGLLQGSRWHTLEPGPLVTGSVVVNTYRVPLSSGAAVYFKRYVYNNKYRYFLQQSRAANEVYCYQQLADIGIQTLEPLVLGEIREFGRLIAACVVTREVPDAPSLDEFARQHWCKLPQAERSRVYREISAEIISQLQRAHRNKFFHFDLKWRNILVRRDADGHYRCTWIDCPRGRYMRLRPGRGQLVDLSGLARLALSYLSRSQRLRFIYAYLGDQASRRQARHLFMKIDRHLSRRMPRVFDPFI